MTPPGASADNQQPEPGTRDLADASEQPIPATREAALPESATQIAPSAPRFEIVPAFPAIGADLGLQSAISKMIAAQDLGLSKIINQQAVSLVASMPKLSTVNIGGPAFPAIGADLGLQSAISKMIAAQDLGLSKIINQQAVSLVASMPKLSTVNIGGPAFPAIGADLGLQSAISKMIAAQDLGLSKIINQQAVSLVASMPKLSTVNIGGSAFPAIGADLGLQSAISKMIAAQDLGLSKIINQIGNLSASLTVSSVNLTGMSATASLADLLLRWREVAESGVGVLRGLARAGYKAALHARAAVLRGDDGPVAWFIRTWLGLRVSPERIEAVSAALLEEGWDAGIPDDPAYLITDLRKRTVRQGRVLRPIWKTRVNYRAVGMLDEPVRTSNGGLLTVADLVPGAQPTEDLVLASEWEEQRLRRVLGRLKPDELRVTNVYAQRSELTWAEAARIAGAADPAAVGERIRRKLKRLGAEDERRVALRSSLP